MVRLLLCWFVLLAVAVMAVFTGSAHGGEVTYDGRSLIIDGQRKILFSGSVHYPRSTPEIADNKILDMATSLNCSSYKKYEIRKRNPDPKTCVLLVIDMQNYFSAVAKPILDNLLTTIRLCQRASIPVLFTRHCHKSPADYAMLGEWWNNDLLHDGTVEAQLMPQIEQLASADQVIEKNTYSAFANTRLQERLVEMGVKEVIVSGVTTNVCCETTAREAFVRGFRVFFSTDATGTSDSELHEATLKNLAFGFAYLVDCKRLEAGLFGN